MTTPSTRGRCETCFGPDPRWVLVHVSQRALIYVRRDGPNAVLAADDTGELRAALRRVDQALVGVQASEAGGFTGDPRVDGIMALRAQADDRHG